MLMIQIAAGYGQDTYDANARIAMTAPSLTIPSIDANVSTKRTTMYASAGLNLILARVVAEVIAAAREVGLTTAGSTGSPSACESAE